MKSRKPILLIEDDKVDAMSVSRSIKEMNLINKLEHVWNGEEALEFLKKSEKELPCMLLLDLNMPKMNGLEFLKEIRKNDRYRHIPVIVLTTSGEEKDKVESFKKGICGYIIKPVEHKKFTDILKKITAYWSLSELPN